MDPTKDKKDGGDCGCDCNTARERLYLFLDQEIDSASCEEIQQHIEECSSCLSEYDVERKWRETRLLQIAPISTNLILSYIGQHILGMPRSF